MRNSYWGWVVAGVVCLIIIALAVTGIVNFNPATQTPATSSQQSARLVESVVNGSQQLIHALPLK